MRSRRRRSRCQRTHRSSPACCRGATGFTTTRASGLMIVVLGEAAVEAEARVEDDDHLPHGDRAGFHYAERRAADVVRLAGDWILQPAAGGAPWFAWVHLFDPHAPYDAPPEYRAGRAPYDAEVAYADAMLGALLARLQQARALDRTLVVVTADHGE